MQNNKYIKLYAAFKAGYMGQNILNTYFPFFANILHEKHIEVIDEYLLQKEFHNKYNFEPTASNPLYTLLHRLQNASAPQFSTYIALHKIVSGMVIASSCAIP